MSIDLEKLSNFAITRAKVQLEEHGAVNHPVFVMQFADGSIRPKDTSFIPGEVMNHGVLKELVFQAFRFEVEQSKAPACAIVTEAWLNIATELGLELGIEKLNALYQKHGGEYVRDQGLMTRSETIVCVAQTEEKTLMTYQHFTRDERLKQILYGKRDAHEMSSNQVGGRIKMYGSQKVNERKIGNF